jgi:uncharacterized membrane protein YfcA
MRAFTCRTIATLATVTTVSAVPDAALANGGHLHFGTVDIPLVVIYCVGGFVALVVLFFFANWFRYRRSQSRDDLSQGPMRSRREEEEEDVT